MGTLANQAFKPSNQSAMTTTQPKMPNMGMSNQYDGDNMIGHGGAGMMKSSSSGNMSKAMGGERVPSHTNTKSTP